MPDKPDYAALDAAILDLIRRDGGCSRHRLVSLLEDHQAEMLVAILGDKRNRAPEAEHNLIDRRLQALRKAGHIRYGQLDWTTREHD